MYRAWTAAAWSVLATGVLWAPAARGADTVETFDPGLSDVELYTGWEGLGLHRADQSAFAEGLIGYGVTPRMSLYLAPAFAVDGYLTNAAGGLDLGGFGTPLDTPHFDVDVGLGASTDGEVLAYSTWFELNLDLEPDLARAGLYLRSGLDVFGAVDEQGRSTTKLGTSGTVGAYVTIAERHQLLAELDSAWTFDPEPGAPATEIGAVHLGYNFQLVDHLELINEVSVDIPQSGQDWSFGIFAGVLACVAPAPE
jgi:hypothetical protein